MKKILLGVSLCVAMCACNDIAFLNEPVQESEAVLSRSGETTSTESYTVTPEMVCKYLNIARKGKTINSLTPVVENGDTLAYVAQYADTLGWDLISGDRRLDPILANSETGVLNLSDTINPAVGAVKGIIYTVKQTKESFEIQKNPIWKSLEPKEKKANSNPQARGIGFGKWVELDTIYESEVYTKPHMITTRWHQDYPWNTLCPPDLMRPAKAGCTPIATSQIIYYYRKNDIRNCEIPYDYIVINNKPYFPYKSTSEWSNLRETASSNEDENRSTALFIFYIGDMLGTQYGFEESFTVPYKEIDVLEAFKLAGTLRSSYNYNNLKSSLNANRPVLISCGANDTTSHMFIVDSYRTHTEMIYARRKWDPTIEITDWNDYEEPPVEASNSKDGYAYETRLIGNSERTYISMNWGWNDINNVNDVYYMAYSYTSSINYGDYSSPEYSYTYPANWSVTLRTDVGVSNLVYNRFQYMIYNIQNTN